MAIALPVMMARPRPRFRGWAGGGGDAGAVGGASFGGAGWGGGGGISCAAGFGRRASALVPWSCAFSRPACPFFGRPVPPPGWPSPAPGWPCLRRGDLAALPAPPLGPAARGPAAGQLARRRRARAGRWRPAAPWSPPPPCPAWVGGRPELARGEPSSAGWAAKRPAIPAVLYVRAAGSPCSRRVPAGAGAPAARPGARAPGLARCQGPRGCAAGRSRTAPAVLTARFRPPFRARLTPWERGTAGVLCHANPPGCVHDGAIAPRQRSTERSANQHKPVN